MSTENVCASVRMHDNSPQKSLQSTEIIRNSLKKHTDLRVKCPMQINLAIRGDLRMPHVSHHQRERFARLAGYRVAALAHPTSGTDFLSPMTVVSIFRFDAIFDCVLSEKACNNFVGRFL